jgi:cytochrome c oxidase subunit III
VSTKAVLDLESLPPTAHGSRSLTWWATALFLAIEGTMLVGLLVSYFYLRRREPDWPAGVEAPDPLWGTVTLAALLLSCIPNHLCKKAAEGHALHRTRFWLTVLAVASVVPVVPRVLEFPVLNVSWDTNAYGSIVWALMGFHTAHMLTDVVDTLVLTAYLYMGPLELRRFSDVEDNSVYWYFVVLFWAAIYPVVYFGPYWL